MIRVLQVVNAADRGGSETLAMNIYRNIDRSVIQFDFTNHKGCPAAYDQEIESLGGHIHYLPKFKGYNYFQYVSAWRKLFKLHPEYQIVHIHNYNIAGIVAKVAKEMCVPVRITHSHSTRLNMSPVRKFVFNRLHSSLMRNTTHFFTCGTNAANFLFGDNHPYTLIPNGIDTSRFLFDSGAREKIRKSLNIGDNEIVYGHVGSFRLPKNHTFLIDVFEELHKRQADAKLILVGSGELMPTIKNKVNQKGLQDSVIFAGQQSNVNEWLSAFDIFMMPSLWEGFPVSAVEAQCAGLPCVISDVVDHDADLTGQVTFIPLEKSLDFWVEEILSIGNVDRAAMGKKISGSMFNIDKVTDYITNFYLSNSQSK